MFAKLIAQLKTLFGFSNKKNEIFSQAVLAVFGVAIDSRIFLSGDPNVDEWAAKVAGLARAWSEAAVKISRVDDGLRDNCLEMVRYFSKLPPADTRGRADGLARTDTILEEASKFLQEGGKLLN